MGNANEENIKEKEKKCKIDLKLEKKFINFTYHFSVLIIFPSFFLSQTNCHYVNCEKVIKMPWR